MEDRVAAARAMALAAHGDQRYGAQPYEVHLAHVERVVLRYVPAAHPGHLELRVAAWLHDVVEDTPVSLDAVRGAFGAEVAALVGAVTDGPGRDRKERKARTYPRIRAAGPGAVLLKLSDRVANVEASLSGAPSKLGMYRGEWWGFYGALYDPADGSHQPMWAHLEGLIEGR